MSKIRPVPEILYNSAEQKQRRGHLRIFFGYASGAGKTYTMLQAAMIAKEHGVDVVLGYLAPDVPADTAALAQGLEWLGNKKQRKTQEFDLDAAISRKPQLILMDELAHVNEKGCRHARRYQDVEELLKEGIDVYTTLNVQNIEGLNDIISNIVKVPDSERIPDFIFDDADQVEFIDMEPQKLIKRMRENKMDRKQQEEFPAVSCFSEENLTALREIAARRYADREERLAEKERGKKSNDYYADEHILVCLSTSPSNAKIVRTAARMANVFHGTFTALFVETPDFAYMDEQSVKRLQENMHLAEQLGAKIEVIYSDDISFQIAEFARLSGVTKIVIGRSSATRTHIFGKMTLTERLILDAPNLDMYIIPDFGSEKAIYRARKFGKRNIVFSAGDILKSVGLLLLASVIGFFFYNLGIDEANIITIYVLSVLLTAIVTKNQIYSLISSIVSVLVFNFLFTEPRFTLQAYDTGYPITFVVMFLSAFITGSLVMRLKSHFRQSASVAFRTRILFDTNRLLQQAKGRDDIISITVSQLMKLLEKDIIVYTEEKGKLEEPQMFSKSGQPLNKKYISEEEKKVALWTFKNNKHAGATTETFSDAQCLYLAIRVNDNVYGVIGIVMEKNSLEAFENSILLSILGECALALENEKITREKEEAAVLAQNEQLRANLLRSISHDLRTPLTSISGNASNLMSMGEEFDEATKKQLYADIYEDAMWLINLVENLLSITRLVEGRLNLNITEDLIDDVIAEALQHVNKKNVEHLITVESEEEFLLAKMDSRLIVQVVINIVNNAIEYTPKGSHIKITVKKQNQEVVVSIADDGNGISDDAKAKVFDMFYSGENKIADSRRNCGIGLSLCKSIINAHGGEISVSDNKPHGAVFTFTLPAKEARLHE
ncbi:MAG: sensor histidine kinase KdpD [Eubacteriales bacterium]|nr:sensor histidine kinase KdpD [Eubacteriales bacterium]